MKHIVLFLIGFAVVLMVLESERITGEDSIAYIEDATLQSPLSAEDLLGLAEVQDVEDWCSDYNNATHRDSAAMRLANRFMRMGSVVQQNGNANDKLEWAVAVNVVLDTLRAAVPSLSPDSALNEITRVVHHFTSMSQWEMNMVCYVDAMVDYYRTVESYRQWISSVPSSLRSLAQDEYEAWHDLNEARFEFWRDVSFTQEGYSSKPMDIEGFYEVLSSNRRAELELERGIVLDGISYKQKGTTVTVGQWEKWIADHSVPEDIELVKEIGRYDEIPSDSIVENRVRNLRFTFSRWIIARQEMASALPKEQSIYYAHLTDDIHCRMIGQLDNIVPKDTLTWASF